MAVNVAMLLSNPLHSDMRVQKEARELQRSGYTVKVFSWDRECVHPTHEIRDGFEIERVRVRSTYGRGILQAPALMIFMLKVVPKICRFAPRVLHCHDLETLLRGLFISIITRAKVVFDAHEPAYYSDPDLRAKMRANGMRAARERYNWDIAAKGTHVS